VEKMPPLPSISCSGRGGGLSALAAAWAPAGPAEGLSTATGGWAGEVEEGDEVWDELPAGSAAVVVQANAEAKASQVIRV